jgi:hypothetical protein
MISHRDMPAVGFDNSFGDRHAEAGSGRFRRVEWFKDSLALLLGKSGAVVV